MIIAEIGSSGSFVSSETRFSNDGDDDDIDGDDDDDDYDVDDVPLYPVWDTFSLLHQDKASPPTPSLPPIHLLIVKIFLAEQNFFSL